MKSRGLRRLWRATPTSRGRQSGANADTLVKENALKLEASHKLEIEKSKLEAAKLEASQKLEIEKSKLEAAKLEASQKLKLEEAKLEIEKSKLAANLYVNNPTFLFQNLPHLLKGVFMSCFVIVCEPLVFYPPKYRLVLDCRNTVL